MSALVMLPIVSALAKEGNDDKPNPPKKPVSYVNLVFTISFNCKFFAESNQIEESEEDPAAEGEDSSATNEPQAEAHGTVHYLLHWFLLGSSCQIKILTGNVYCVVWSPMLKNAFGFEMVS